MAFVVDQRVFYIRSLGGGDDDRLWELFDIVDPRTRFLAM